MKLIKNTAVTILIALSLCQTLTAKEQQQFQETRQHLSAKSEALLMSALENISQSKIDEALTDLDKLRSINPKFNLAQLI